MKRRPGVERRRRRLAEVVDLRTPNYEKNGAATYITAKLMHQDKLNKDKARRITNQYIQQWGFKNIKEFWDAVGYATDGNGIVDLSKNLEAALNQEFSQQGQELAKLIPTLNPMSIRGQILASFDKMDQDARLKKIDGYIVSLDALKNFNIRKTGSQEISPIDFSNVGQELKKALILANGDKEIFAKKSYSIALNGAKAIGELAQTALLQLVQQSIASTLSQDIQQWANNNKQIVSVDELPEIISGLKSRKTIRDSRGEPFIDITTYAEDKNTGLIIKIPLSAKMKTEKGHIYYLRDRTISELWGAPQKTDAWWVPVRAYFNQVPQNAAHEAGRLFIAKDLLQIVSNYGGLTGFTPFILVNSELTDIGTYINLNIQKIRFTMKQSIKSYREQATGENNITGWLDQAIIANIVSTALGNVTSQ